MLKDDSRARAVADRLPDRLAEGARALCPSTPLRAGRIGHRTPMVEFVTIDHADRATIETKLPFVFVGYDGDGASALGADDLQRHATKPAGRAPDEHDIVLANHVGRPAHQHAIGGRRAQHIARRFLPGEVLGFREALVRLRPRELAVAAVVRLIAPDAGARRQHLVFAGKNPRVVRLPPAAVNHDLVTERDVRYLVADRPDNTSSVAAARVEIFGLALLLPVGDHVDRVAKRRPDVVVVDPRGHDVNEHVLGSDRRRGDHLALPGILGFVETVLTYDKSVHLMRHAPQGRTIAQIEKCLLIRGAARQTIDHRQSSHLTPESAAPIAARSRPGFSMLRINIRPLQFVKQILDCSN